MLDSRLGTILPIEARMYLTLHALLPARAADLVYVVLMALLISATLLLAAFPETSLRYARL